MNEAYPLPNLLEFAFLFNRLYACKLANSHHASFTLYLFSTLSHIFTLFNHLCEFLCTFYAIYCVVILHHLPAVFVLHCYDFSVACCQQFLQRDGQFCVFCLCTSYCSLFLVISKLHVIRG